MQPLKVIRPPLLPTHTRFLERLFMSSLADLSQVLMEETDMLEDVEDLTHEAEVNSKTVAVEVEVLLEAGERAHPPTLDL